MLRDYFYNPERSFEYVSDSVLWNKIFTNSFPKDINDPTKGMIRLSNYFQVAPALIINPNGPKKERKLLQPLEYFYKAKKDDRNQAFLSLCDFLIHFGRPYRDCIINLPKHESVDKDPKYSPIRIYYKQPIYPVIDKSDHKLQIQFQKDFYRDVHKYCFGKEPDPSNKILIIRFTFNCFCGFVLQY